MKYDFDAVTERRGTDSLKYDYAAKRGRPADILPLWVADTDFPAPREVTEALIARARHGAFGYTEPMDDYFETLQNWFARRHGWKTVGDRFVLSCGVVFAINCLIRVLTKEGDGVIIMQPVYYPFEESILVNKRKLVVSQLVNDGGYYHVDFDNFERKITENAVRLFILCSPHNPVGRVWTGEELKKMGDICRAHGVFVISDEIHADFVYGGNRHRVFSTVDPVFEEFSVICTAPTKTFNIAGLHNANIYIPDEGLRRAYLEEHTRVGYSQSNVMGIDACRAAYRYGDGYVDQLNDYIYGNMKFIKQFLDEKMPQVKFRIPQGTYLAWLDFSAYGLNDGALRERMTYQAGVWLDDGCIFGAGGSGFQRVNAACPRATLRQALERIYAAFE